MRSCPRGKRQINTLSEEKALSPTRDDPKGPGREAQAEMTATLQTRGSGKTKDEPQGPPQEQTPVGGPGPAGSCQTPPACPAAQLCTPKTRSASVAFPLTRRSPQRAGGEALRTPRRRRGPARPELRGASRPFRGGAAGSCGPGNGARGEAVRWGDGRGQGQPGEEARGRGRDRKNDF